MTRVFISYSHQDEHMLFMKADMAMFSRGGEDARLTEEGAAEHLWSMFLGHLQQ